MTSRERIREMMNRELIREMTSREPIREMTSREPIPVKSSRAAVSKPEAIRPTAARLRRIRTRITETKPLWKPATILTF